MLNKKIVSLLVLVLHTNLTTFSNLNKYTWAVFASVNLNDVKESSKPPGIGTSLPIAVRSRVVLILKYLISLSSQEGEIWEQRHKHRHTRLARLRVYSNMQAISTGTEDKARRVSASLNPVTGIFPVWNTTTLITFFGQSQADNDKNSS